MALNPNVRAALHEITKNSRKESCGSEGTCVLSGPGGCLKNAFTRSSKITALHCQNRDKHHLYCQEKHQKAECFYQVISDSMTGKEGILLPLKTQLREKLKRGEKHITSYRSFNKKSVKI